MSAKREFWLLFTLAGIQFTHIMDFMIMMPLGPQFTRIFNISDAQFGMLVSSYTLAAGFSGLAAATYIDRFSRKRLMLCLYGAFGLATLGCALAPNYATLMAARIGAGIFGGILSSLSQTIVGDVIPFERRGRAMGVVMTSFSVASVFGVPGGLFLATLGSWHAPFFVIAALCAVLALFAALTLPTLDGHLKSGHTYSALGRIGAVLADANHLKVFAFSALMMFGGFTVIPYLAINLQYGVGLRPDQIPYAYLFGGAGAFVTARWIGHLTDRWGKVKSFKLLAVVVVLPVFAVTLMPWGSPFWLVILVSAVFMICMSGRMIPGMAIVTSAANPGLRGTFMTLNSAVQSAAMGVAAWVGGLLITRNAEGLLQNYWHGAVITTCASLASIWVAGKLKLHTGVPAARVQMPAKS
jgi:predicted MFS family arabinose efflux permease